MSYRSGIASQFGFAAETTFGTYATATRFQEFASESLALNIDRIESAGLRKNQAFLATDRWAAGKKGVAGDISFDGVMTKNFGLFFKNMLGAVATSSDGAGYKHAFTPGDLSGLSMSMEMGRPQIDGTVKSYQYAGVKVASWEISNSVDQLLALKLTVDGVTESTAGSLATASYPTAQELFVFTEGALTIGGTPTPIDSFSLTGDNGLKTDRYKIASSGNKLEQLVHAIRSVSGSLSLDFIDQTLYTDFVAGTTATLVLTYTGVTAYDTGKLPRVIITLQNCRFDGTTVNVTSPDVLTQTIPFKALDDRTNPVIEIDYYTADATP